ncbi:MAG: hydroxymethylbilane synthase [Nitrospinae bacterium]|nr:hydroxymethylbilane synthase [Nitrospinota bacterium]
MHTSIRLGTRGSALALQQTQAVVDRLKAAWPAMTVEIIVFKTKGDKILDVPLAKIGDKGLFVKELEDALLSGRIDLAVHSVKDLPSRLPDGLIIGVIPEREDPRDALVARDGLTLATLPEKSVIGTSSLRRRAQLLHWRPDLDIVPLRGNIDTRLRKLETEGLDGIVIAAAGLLRMGWEARISQVIPPEICLPAVGQGALGIEIRADDVATHALLQPLASPAAVAAVGAERSFLAHLEGGCQVPIAAWATVEGAAIHLHGMLSTVDGLTLLRGERRGAVEAPERVGGELAAELLVRGGDAILREIYGPPADQSFPPLGEGQGEGQGSGLPDMRATMTPVTPVADKPLAGRKILITRPREQASRFSALLREYGAEPIEIPTIQIDPPSSWEPLDRAIAAIHTYDWLVFTSVNGVQALFMRLEHLGRARAELQGLKLCAIGPETAQHLRARGLHVEVVPSEYRAEAVVEALSAFPLQGKRMLIPRAAVAREVLPRALAAQGAHVEVVEVYRTGLPTAQGAADVRQLLEQRQIAAVTFTSSSTVENFAVLMGGVALPDLLQGVVVACIGPITAETARSYGLTPEILPEEYTIPALARAIGEYFREEGIKGSRHPGIK